MISRKSSDKSSRNVDEILRESINDTLQSFIDEKLKNSIESSIVESLNNYIATSIDIDDPKQIIRAYYKNTAAIQENSATVQELHDKVKQYLDKILIEQRQKNGERERKIQAWEQAAINFFILLERAYETDENKRSIEKILSEFERIVINVGLERIIPQHDELLNEKFHEAVEEQESHIVPGNILKCTGWGYRIGDNVIHKAKVVVAKAPVEWGMGSGEWGVGKTDSNPI